jgi:uncharacterized protein (DUF1499 family)
MKSIRFLIYFLVIMAFFSGCSGKEPAERGIRGGKFLPCPQKPNCVSTMSQESSHGIAPITYQQSREKALAELKGVVKELGNAEIKEELNDYLWVECTSKLMGFVDDVEFYLPEDQKIIHVRSASRLGYSDMGVNRKRVERIRILFSKKSDSSQ